tara:strand:- start:1189 stop:1752 length:564 start_codon:yes stop_codon:yes gene_type:complete
MPVTPEELINLFGDDFSDILDTLDELPPDIETMLLGVINKMIFDVNTFGNNIEKTIFTLEEAGMSNKVIKETLEKDMLVGGMIFGKLSNDIKAAIIDGINQSAKMGQYENYDLEKGRFHWVTVGGHRICPDCAERPGIIMSFKNWESAGLPGSGWSVCRGYCYCVLDPSGEISKNVDAPVKEKIPRA